MILFFDKNIGTSIPLALEKLKPPFQVEFHQKYFAMDEQDDVWLPEVGKKNWTVIGHDRKFHEKESELDALKKYKIGCFCLWGAEVSKWDKVKLFFRAYEKIALMESGTPKPFIFSIKKNGNLKRIKLP